MDFTSVINFMKQQSEALEELEKLIAYDEEQGSGHSIKAEDINALKNYISGMKVAVDTATALAKHYKPEPTKETTKEADKQKKKSTKKKPKKEEPKAPEPEEEFDFLS